MKATEFLAGLYRIKGVREALDGIALHPYIPDVDGLRREVEDLRRSRSATGTGGPAST